MLFIICVEKLLHIGSHFSLRKWRRRPHFPTKLAAVASFSHKFDGGGLIFLHNWRWWQGFVKITGCCSDMVWIWEVSQPRGRHFYQKCHISNPGRTILTKNVLIISNPGGRILVKYVLFTTQGAQF